MSWNELPDQLIQARKSDKTPRDCVNIVGLTGTPQIGVGKESGTKN